jgi:hypothetical protein
MKGRISRALVSTSAHHNAATVGGVDLIPQLAPSAAAATELLYHHLCRMCFRFYFYLFLTSWNVIQSYPIPMPHMAS